MSGTVASLIEDFSLPASQEGFSFAILRQVRKVAEVEPERAPSAAERQEELIKAMEARVRAEEREAARRRLEEALDAERERHRADLEVQRGIWVEQEALQLSSQIVEAMRNLEDVLSARVAAILGPILPEALQQKALAEFNAILAGLLSKGASSLITITGPADVLGTMEAGLAHRSDTVEFLPSEDVEVKVVIGDTTVQTQFGSWSSRLREALKAE